MRTGEGMEVIFLLAGLVLIAVSVAIAVSEIRDRQGTWALKGRVIGFSSGRHNKPTSPSFHSVAEYVGPDGQTYFVEGAIGSSEPLHSVGDSVTILVKSDEPEKAVLKSSLSFILSTVLGIMGLALVVVFHYTFRANLLSLGMAAVLLIGGAFKVAKAWRKPGLSWNDWLEYKKQIFTPRVFTNQTRDQIRWADPTSVVVAVESYRKSRRLAVPVLFVLGLTALFFGYHFHVKMETFLAKADPAPGRVISLQETDPTASADSSTYAAVVEFRDKDGETHTFVDSLSSSSGLYDYGEEVIVLFDRSNPSAAQIDRGRANYWVSFVLYGMGSLFLLMGWSSRKRRVRH